jgi:hypothetical protein
MIIVPEDIEIGAFVERYPWDGTSYDDSSSHNILNRLRLLGGTCTESYRHTKTLDVILDDIVTILENQQAEIKLLRERV